jgi:hypothetical protein
MVSQELSGRARRRLRKTFSKMAAFGCMNHPAAGRGLFRPRRVHRLDRGGFLVFVEVGGDGFLVEIGEEFIDGGAFGGDAAGGDVAFGDPDDAVEDAGAEIILGPVEMIVAAGAAEAAVGGGLVF